jgi:osmotically-inducible protein OsmY
MTFNRSLAPDDRSVTEALETFLQNASCDHVSVQCRDGVASLRGNVPSDTARTAIEDLVLAHDGVRSVENRLVVDATTRPSGNAAEEIENRR